MNKERVLDISKRYRKKSENAFRTYQETGKTIYDWFYREYEDISDICNLALNAGVAIAADAILIPEIKFDVDNLVRHIKQTKRDYGIIMVAEGISIRG